MNATTGLFDDVMLEQERMLDEIVTGYRDLYGTWNVGSLEEDPEMSEYEELVELGCSLRGANY